VKALVTGGAGFIGSHLVTTLVDAGHEVVVIDNFSTGRRENLASVLTYGHLTVIRADVADPDSIAAHFDGVDWVFHLAGLADIVPSIADPSRYHRSNVDGTLAVLEASRRAGVKRFVYAASSSCYGIPDLYPTPETALPRPQYPYALSKWLGEQLVLHWGAVYRLPVVSLRLFNVYGPRSRTTGAYGAVFGVFLAQKLHNQPFTVVGDGTQTRDFIFVTDVARAFVSAAQSTVTNDVFNVGAGMPRSINDLVALIGGPVTHVPKRPGEPERTHADVRKIHTAFGWSATVTFEDGVKKLLNDLQAWRDAPLWTPASIADATRDWFQYLGPSVDAT
jgi:UDP-glucose 4-epimerase